MLAKDLKNQSQEFATDGQYGHQHDRSHDGPEIVMCCVLCGFLKNEGSPSHHGFQHVSTLQKVSKGHPWLRKAPYALDGCTITAGTAGRPDHRQGVATARQGRGHLGEVLADASEVVLTALGPMVPSNFLGAKNDILCVCVSYMYIFIDTYNVCIIYIYILNYTYTIWLYIIYIYIQLYIIYVSGSWGFNHHLPIPGGSSSWNSDTPRSPRDLPGCWMLLLEMMDIYGVHSIHVYVIISI